VGRKENDEGKLGEYEGEEGSTEGGE